MQATPRRHIELLDAKIHQAVCEKLLIATHVECVFRTAHLGEHPRGHALAVRHHHERPLIRPNLLQRHPHSAHPARRHRVRVHRVGMKFLLGGAGEVECLERDRTPTVHGLDLRHDSGVTCEFPHGAGGPPRILDTSPHLGVESVPAVERLPDPLTCVDIDG